MVRTFLACDGFMDQGVECAITLGDGFDSFSLQNALQLSADELDPICPCCAFSIFRASFQCQLDIVQHDQVFLDDGSPINPEGSEWVDPGLGGFLASLDEDYFNALGLDKTETVAGNWGKHKVPTLRNVAKSSGNKFPKAYMHNGVFKSLEEVVHFYNTRDVEDWPEPEVAMNVNTNELGDLGLTIEEEEAIVAFMRTLSDGYDPAKDKVKNNKSATFAIRGANPFNPTTSFTYSITEDANVQIYVYNALGQKVATLMSSYKPAGTYQIEFNAANLSSGIYFVQFSTENSILPQKISLLK